jgi:hypothetical protein
MTPINMHTGIIYTNSTAIKNNKKEQIGDVKIRTSRSIHFVYQMKRKEINITKRKGKSLKL